MPAVAIPAAARIALLIAGIVLLLVAVLGTVAAALKHHAPRSSHIWRAAAAVVGAALVIWAAVLGPRAAPAHPDLVFLAGSELDGCVAPARPADAAPGGTATQAQMQASQATAKAFDAATDSYLSCLKTTANEFLRQYGRGMSPATLQAVEALQTRVNNAAVDVDQSVADQFNQQLRIFQARSGS